MVPAVHHREVSGTFIWQGIYPSGGIYCFTVQARVVGRGDEDFV